MSIKKAMAYGRYVMLAVLIFYLILVWMYFKDNALQLTPKSLLIWFVLIPLAIVTTIIILTWQQKKLELKVSAPTPVRNKPQADKQPDIHTLFIKSSICLPEGESWAEIVDNEEDLTVLNTDFQDFDGLPILTKPLSYLITDPNLHNELIESNMSNNFEHDASLSNENIEEQTADLDDVTLRLSTLIHQQLALNEETLSTLSALFETLNYHDNNEPNSAISIHPEWQQPYIAGAADSESKKTATDSILASQIQLSFFICLPAYADSNTLKAIIKQQVLSYELPEQYFTITMISDDDNEENTNDDRVTPYSPEGFINDQLIRLSKALEPEICFLIIADSQINESWLESSLYMDAKLNSLPTEASMLLLFSNQTAQDYLNMDVTRFSFTNINDLSSDDTNSTPNNSDRRHYANSLKYIKQLLVENSFNLPALEDTLPQSKSPSTPTKKQQKNSDSEQTMANDSLLNNKITALSDINPTTQPFDLVEFMTLIDSFNEKGALVNEHHLGHYMPLNVWLKSFIGLALLADLAPNKQQPLEFQLLITQYKRHCMLWLASHS